MFICQRRISVLFGWVLLSVAYAGCSIHRELPEYRLSIEFLSHDCVQLDDVTVIWGGTSVTFGKVLGEENSIDFYSEIPPDTFTVSWSKNGERYSSTGKVDKQTREAYAQYHSIAVLVFPDHRVGVVGWPRRRDKLATEIYHSMPYYKARADGHAVFFVGIKNATGKTYTNLKVSMSDKVLKCGGHFRSNPAKKNHLGYWGNKGWVFAHGFPFDVSNHFDFSWDDLEGNSYSGSVDLTGKLPDNIEHQTLCFVILNENDIRFEVRPWKDRDTWKLEKFYGRE